MGLLDQCEELFKTSNLYDVIGVTNDASEAEVRRGYYKVSLQVHPDRSPGDGQATAKFQVGKTTLTFKKIMCERLFTFKTLVDILGGAGVR